VNEDQPQLRDIFNEAVEIADARQRAAYLAAACGADAALRQRIEELIRANDDAGPFLGGAGDTIARAAQNSPSTLAPTEKPDARAIRYFGDYQLLGEIARGGMGIVFKARQTTLNRTVALKMILDGKLASPALMQRFHTEAEAAANLKHPNIVPIHEVGEHDGQHYFSMDYVEGQNLAERMRQGPMTLKQAAGCVQTIAGAIHYAHQRGVLHRDLKPSNILLDRQGQPHVTDFGLAKLVEQGSNLTQSEVVMGTPSYMAPEQAAGDIKQLTIAADIYSLGAILYELLAGRPPFHAGTALETMRQVMEQEPEAPSLARSSRRKEAPIEFGIRNSEFGIDQGLLTSAATEPLDRDLETICLKCLHKDPAGRYGSAEALAEDLARWQAGETILARPVSQAERFWRWCRRKRAIASLALTVAILIMAVAVGSILAGVRIARESERARQAEREALEKKQAATDELWDSYLAQARANRLNGRAGRRFDSLEVLAKAAAIRPSLELRNEAIACLALGDIRLLKESKALKKHKEFVCLDRNQERYAVADERGDVHICQISDDKELMVLPGAVTPAWPLIRFSPNGQLLAVCSAEGRARIWDWHRKESILDVPTAAYGDLDFSPDSRWLATSDSNLHLFDLTRGQEWSLKESTRGGRAVRFDGTGKLLAIGHVETIQILEAFSGKILLSLKHPGTRVYGVAWHPDGRHLASACEDRLVYVWDTRRGELDRVLKGHDREVAALAFNHTGDILASAGFDRTTRLWDFKSGRELVRVTGGGSDLQFSLDDQRLGCHSWDANWFEIFEVAPIRVVRAFHEATGGAQRGYGPVGFTSDGALLAYSAREQLKVWDVASGQEMVSHYAGWLGAVLFDASGENLFLSGLGGVSRWPIHPASITGELRLGPPVALTPSGDFGRAALSANGKLLAVLATNRCHIFCADSTGEPARTEIQSWMRFVAVHPAGTWIATGAWGQEGIKVWDGSTGRLSQELPSGEHTAVIFSPDGRWLVAGSEDGYRFWKTGEWTPGLRIAHDPRSGLRDTPSMMAFSPDGSMLALTDPQTAVRLVDSASGRELATLEADNGKEISSLAFSPDATWLAVACGSDSLHVWDLRALRQHLAKLGFDWEAPALSSAREPEVKSAKVIFMSDDPALTPERRAELLAKIPARDPQAAPTLIDLSEYYNVALTESTFGLEENTLASLPHGLQTFKGVTFDVRGQVQLSGGRPLKRTFPPQVSNIKVGLRCRRLHFLQASGGAGVPQGTTVGDYVVHYADGSALQVALRYGLSIRDYWGHSASGHVDTERFFAAWTGTNPAVRRDGHFLRLFQWTWDNPEPERAIASLDFVSAMTGVAPFLIAITAE
jgi:serine/threonine protein kinase/WD40 repeat protein